MIGAPEFKQQPSGPFVWRKWYNQIVTFCNALARMEIKGGGKIVYGENKVIIDLSNDAVGDVTFDVWENGVLVNYDISAGNRTVIGTISP